MSARVTGRQAVTATVLLAYGVGLVLDRLHAGVAEAHAVSPLVHWLRDSTLALLPAAVAVAAASWWLRRPSPHGIGAGRLRWAQLAAVSYAVLSVPAGLAHGVLFVGSDGGLHPAHLLAQSAAVLGAGFAVLLLALAAPIRISRFVPRLSMAGRAGVVALVVTALVVPVAGLPTSAPAPARAAPTGCTSASADRRYDVAAISVPIPFNRWGDRIPGGEIYALQSDKAAIRNWSVPLAANPTADPAGNRRLRPRPLVLRANVGECVEVHFTNELDDNPNNAEGQPARPRASMHVNGAAYDASTSDGGAVGFNPDTTVANRDDPATPQQDNAITYHWQVPAREGLYLFKDRATTAGSEADGGSTAVGLYGALAVEPAGSRWADPTTGAPLYTGTGAQSGELYVAADIIPVTGKAFRESVMLSQDEIPSIGFGFNYGAEPGRNRIAQRCADCIGEETSLSSWAYGDPGSVKLASGPGPWLPDKGVTDPETCGLPVSCRTSNVVHTYRGDPVKIRFAHAGIKETHVFHLHAHQWLAQPGDVGAAGPTPSTPGPGRMPKSNTIDSQTYGPGDSYTADLLFASGSKPGTIGDSIFHCHLYPHFAEGFWALLRTHDVREDGSGRTPDRILVPALRTLTDRVALPTPTVDNPGYPRFIPGQFGWRAPQPPGGITRGGPTGPAAPRIVAGRLADPAALAVEAAVQRRAYAGKPAKPGAPLADPCPTGAREVTYNVSVIQRDVVYNEAGWHDTQGRMLVLDKDVAAVLAGTKPPEPFFFRANAGDCINFTLTNRLPTWFGNDAFQQLVQTNMIGQHIHLVKFDVLGSDGSSNGWNYQEAAFSDLQSEFNDRVLAGTQPCAPTDCRLPLPAAWDPTTPTVGNVGQTIKERWYADYELRTVFTHDHHFPAIDQARGLFGALVVEPKGMDTRNPQTGRYLQPLNSAAHGPVCKASCIGEAVGPIVDQVGPARGDDFREFGIAVQDFVSLTKKGGDPAVRADTINPPKAPEEYASEDPGVMGINYRNAPFVLRQNKNGVPQDPAYTFSSTLWGDPQTPVLQAYGGDNVRFRVIQGAQEEQHLLTVHGMRWREEPDDPKSRLTNVQPIGISEAFNFQADRLSCTSRDTSRCTGDYLYGGTATDDLFTGMWGIFRVYARRNGLLLPLPDNAPNATPLPLPRPIGRPPLQANNPGNPCPGTAPRKTFSVVAMQTKLTYNKAGDHDPYGLVYVLAEEEAAVRAGRVPTPLTLRVNSGDCAEVTLTNKLTPAFLAHRGALDGDPNLPAEDGPGRHAEEGSTVATPAGLRVSLHPQLLGYDVRGSDGATVGYNRDQTVAPGASRIYRWYATPTTPVEIGPTNLVDFGDVRGHRHHGLFGGIVVEPKGSSYADPRTGAALRNGPLADIRRPGVPDRREATIYFQDGLNLRERSGAIIPDPMDHGGVGNLDAEDQGEKGFNYANEPFARRIGAIGPAPDGDRLAHVFDSRVHGDPVTPIIRAYAGDPLSIHVLQGADKPRQHVFAQSGLAWFAARGDPGSELVGAQGGISVGRALTVEANVPDAVGDYQFGCQVGFHHQSGGLWGLLRVYPRPTDASVRLTPIPPVDDPRLGGRPVAALDTDRIAASVFIDRNRDGLRQPTETLQAGVTVASEKAGTLEAQAASGDTGIAWLVVRAGSHAVRAVPGPGWVVTGVQPVTVTTSGTDVAVRLGIAPSG